MKWKQFLLLWGLGISQPALAWGPEGHEVVAHLAALNLTPKAKAQISALLGGEAEASMAIASNWADEIRDARPQTSGWHFVNLEVDADLHYRPARDCVQDDCAVGQILRNEAVLKSGAPAPQKTEALKFLIHLVGDIHQPLHAGEKHDRGGNSVRVSFRGGRPMSLHHFWDDDVVAMLGKNPAVVAQGIDAALGAAQKTALMGSGDPAGWAEESAGLAKAVIYPQLRGQADGVLQDRDVMQDAGIARLQLAKAGYALAGMLNRIFR